MSDSRFYICRHCGNLVGMINSSGVPMICCGEKMQRLEPNTVDASAEKHVPKVLTEGERVKVTVGSALHPMTGEHYIEWIFLETEHGGQRRALKPGEEPAAEFVCTGDSPLAVYAYCNLHGLWVAEV